MKILKKVLMSISLAFIFCFFYNNNVMAEEGTYGDFTYLSYEEDEYAYVSGYYGPGGDVVIPEKINGYYVKYVYSEIFVGDNKFKSITIPASVNYIDLDYNIIAPEGKIVLLGNETSLYLKNSNSNKKVYIECNYNSHARYLPDVEYIFRDGIDISKAEVKITPKELTRENSWQYPEVEVIVDGKKLIKNEDYYTDRVEDTEDIKIGEVTLKIISMYNEKTKVYGETEVKYNIIPDSVGKVSGNINTTHNRVGLKWNESTDVTGYEVYRLDNNEYKLVGVVESASKITYIDKNLKEATAYTYKIRAYKLVKGKKFYSEFSDAVMVYTLPKNLNNRSFKLTNKRINIKATIDSVTAYDGYNSNWTSPSEINDFVDYRGRYTIAYAGGNYVYLQRYNSNLKHLKTLKIKKKYPQLGDVICDSLGNYYIAWGKNDTKGKGNVVTFAISKYNYKGKHIKTARLKSYSGYDGKEIFEAGNCAMAIQGNHLVCSYAKQMYNGHQKNETFAVNINNMKRVDGYSYWVSHSFNQRVIPLKDGGVLFGDHGDANVTRGFVLNYNHIANGQYITFLPFHFWGLNTNDMFHINKTYAQLGNIGEVGTGYVLVGTSAKSMTSSAPNQKQQLMMQIIDPATGNSVLKGSTRSGTCLGIKCKDTGIKWLTNYKDGSYATNSNMIVIDNDLIVVMWERHKDYEFKNSYYMVISSTGKILKKATSLKGQRLCGNEELNYYDGYIYWTSSERNYIYDWKNGSYEERNTIIHKLKVANIK